MESSFVRILCEKHEKSMKKVRFWKNYFDIIHISEVYINHGLCHGSNDGKLFIVAL